MAQFESGEILSGQDQSAYVPSLHSTCSGVLDLSLFPVELSCYSAVQWKSENGCNIRMLLSLKDCNCRQTSISISISIYTGVPLSHGPIYSGHRTNESLC